MKPYIWKFLLTQFKYVKRHLLRNDSIRFSPLAVAAFELQFKSRIWMIETSVLLGSRWRWDGRCFLSPKGFLNHSTSAISCRGNHTAIRAHHWEEKQINRCDELQCNRSHSVLLYLIRTGCIPWPLAVFVCQWDVNHTHQRFPEESTIALTVILLQNLASTLWAHRQNKPPTWFQLFQELLMHMFK